MDIFEKLPDLGRLMARLLGILLLLIALIGSISVQADGACRLRMSVTDLDTYQQIQSEFGRFASLLSQYIECTIDFVPFRSRTAAVDALRRQRVELVLTGPAEYVVFRKLTRAAPLIAFSRPDYHSALLVLADGGPARVEDLRGQTVVFGDVGSTSNHLAPMQLLADHGLDPLHDIQSIHIKRINRKQAWELLKAGKVRAIGMNFTRLEEMRWEETELNPGAFRFLARSRDLPSDVLLTGPHLDPALADRLRRSLMAHEVELIKAILVGRDNQKYQGMKFLYQVKDSDYDYIRQMYKTIGYPSYSSFLSEPGAGTSPKDETAASP
jgi:phosphonate transport system substrate-binding protein